MQITGSSDFFLSFDSSQLSTFRERIFEKIPSIKKRALTTKGEGLPNLIVRS